MDGERRRGNGKRKGEREVGGEREGYSGGLLLCFNSVPVMD